MGCLSRIGLSIILLVILYFVVESNATMTDSLETWLMFAFFFLVVGTDDYKHESK